MKAFIDALQTLCKEHSVTLEGQLLVWPETLPQTVEYAEQAQWGEFSVRDRASIVFSPIVPERVPEIFNNTRKLHIASDIEGYTCPVTNEWVEGRSAHRENLKRRGCRVLEPGEREQFIKEKPREIERQAERTADFLSDRIAERWNS